MARAYGLMACITWGIEGEPVDAHPALGGLKGRISISGREPIFVEFAVDGGAADILAVHALAVAV